MKNNIESYIETSGYKEFFNEFSNFIYINNDLNSKIFMPIIITELKLIKEEKNISDRIYFCNVDNNIINKEINKKERLLNKYICELENKKLIMNKSFELEILDIKRFFEEAIADSESQATKNFEHLWTKDRIKVEDIGSIILDIYSRWIGLWNSCKDKFLRNIYNIMYENVGDEYTYGLVEKAYNKIEMCFYRSKGGELNEIESYELQNDMLMDIVLKILPKELFETSNLIKIDYYGNELDSSEESDELKILKKYCFEVEFNKKRLLADVAEIILLSCDKCLYEELEKCDDKYKNVSKYIMDFSSKKYINEVIINNISLAYKEYKEATEKFMELNFKACFSIMQSVFEKDENELEGVKSVIKDLFELRGKNLEEKQKYFYELCKKRDELDKNIATIDEYMKKITSKLSTS